MGTNVNVGIQKIRVSREKDPQMLINWGKGTSNRPNATTEPTNERSPGRRINVKVNVREYSNTDETDPPTPKDQSTDRICVAGGANPPRWHNMLQQRTHAEAGLEETHDST